MVSLFPNADADTGLAANTDFIEIASKAVPFDSMDMYVPPPLPIAATPPMTPAWEEALSAKIMITTSLVASTAAVLFSIY